MKFIVLHMSHIDGRLDVSTSYVDSRKALPASPIIDAFIDDPDYHIISLGSDLDTTIVTKVAVDDPLQTLLPLEKPCEPKP